MPASSSVSSGLTKVRRSAGVYCSRSVDLYRLQVMLSTACQMLSGVEGGGTLVGVIGVVEPVFEKVIGLETLAPRVRAGM